MGWKNNDVIIILLCVAFSGHSLLAGEWLTIYYD